MPMTKNTSYALGEHFDAYVEKKLSSGRYKNKSEVIREGLRRMEEDDVKLEALRTLLSQRERQIKAGKVVKSFSYESLMEKIDQKVLANNN
jgi:antitoxin ParD1/3/4